MEKEKKILYNINIEGKTSGIAKKLYKTTKFSELRKLLKKEISDEYFFIGKNDCQISREDEDNFTLENNISENNIYIKKKNSELTQFYLQNKKLFEMKITDPNISLLDLRKLSDKISDNYIFVNEKDNEIMKEDEEDFTISEIIHNGIIKMKNTSAVNNEEKQEEEKEEKKEEKEKIKKEEKIEIKDEKNESIIPEKDSEEKKDEDNEIENDTKRTTKEKINDSKKSKKKCGAGIWDDDDDDDDEDEEKNDISKKSETSKSIKSKKKCGAGIWDDDDDDDEDEQKNDISKSINNEDNSKKLENNNISRINETTYESEKLSETNKIKNDDNKINVNLNKDNKHLKNANEIANKNKCRLDDDFKNLKMIGEGGFGVVLRGEHKLDKGICAIKIIKLKDVRDKESIINEARTMIKLTNKHVVHYKYCWTDNNLGTASEFFDDDEEEENEEKKGEVEKEEEEDEYDDDDDEDLNFGFSKTAVDKKNEKLKIIKKKILDDEIKEENEENSIINDSSKKKIDLYKRDKNDNSQEFIKKGSIYFCNYRDDFDITTKSIISKKYIKSNRVKSENIPDDKYFFILMEFCEGLSLKDYIEKYAGKMIDRKIIYNFTSRILKGLVKIHSSGIIHRDIKPANIFIQNDQIKIGDFGMAIKYIKIRKKKI